MFSRVFILAYLFAFYLHIFNAGGVPIVWTVAVSAAQVHTIFCLEIFLAAITIIVAWCVFHNSIPFINSRVNKARPIARAQPCGIGYRASDNYFVLAVQYT